MTHSFGVAVSPGLSLKLSALPAPSVRISLTIKLSSVTLPVFSMLMVYLILSSARVTGALASSLPTCITSDALVTVNSGEASIVIASVEALSSYFSDPTKPSTETVLTTPPASTIAWLIVSKASKVTTSPASNTLEKLSAGGSLPSKLDPLYVTTLV